MQAGAAAIVVSNHGDRQFDGAPPAMEGLPAIDGKIPISVDSVKHNQISRKRTDFLLLYLSRKDHLWQICAGYPIERCPSAQLWKNTYPSKTRRPDPRHLLLANLHYLEAEA
jgi:hypothetical protein